MGHGWETMRVREVKESLTEKRVTDSKLRTDHKVYQQDDGGREGHNMGSSSRVAD